MTRKQALMSSILHWVDNAKVQYIFHAHIFSNSCACCEYNDQVQSKLSCPNSDSCVGCFLLVNNHCCDGFWYEAYKYCAAGNARGLKRAAWNMVDYLAGRYAKLYGPIEAGGYIWEYK